ncbi:MAG: hypothetical protein ACAH65_06785 [Chloroflexota bacterium]
MTLPFRRRHHDDEGPHDRARALVGFEMLEPLADGDAEWLAGHLAECPECRVDRDAYLANRALLRALRDAPPEPPRDLWARTAAALEREQSKRTRRTRPAPLPGGPRPRNPFGRRAPLGVLSGALAVLLLVATSLVPGGPFRPGETGRGAVATPLAVAADRLSWVQGREDGLYQLMFAEVEQVCPDSRAGCAPLPDASRSDITFAVAPQSVVFSPSQHQLVVVSGGIGVDAGTVLVVAVPTLVHVPSPSPASPADSAAAADSGATPSETASVPQTLAPSAPPPQAIATGVTVVGDAAYSPDGTWFAFSARPLGAATGADLYLWKVGDATALPVTVDGATYFSGWFDGQLVASRLSATAPEEAGPAADATAATAPAEGSPAPSPRPEELHPSSFLVDPTTLMTTDLAGPDIWLPAIDPTGRFVAYWSGTVVLDPTGAGWRPATGRLVLDGWSEPLGEPLASAIPTLADTGSPQPAPSAGEAGPAASPAAAASDSAPTEPSPADATSSPDTTVAPTEPPPASPSTGTPPSTEAPPASSAEPTSAEPSSQPSSQPAGDPQALVVGPIADFQMTFDPTGTRLAIWIADVSDPTVGTLQLIVLDPTAGNIDPSLTPLPGVRAMRGFSIDQGRLAWVSPSGQDGAESSVHVLAWSTDTFGEVQTIPASRLFIVR